MQAATSEIYAPKTRQAFQALDAFLAEPGTNYRRRDALLDALTCAIISEFHAWPRAVTRRLVGHPRSREAIRGWVH